MEVNIYINVYHTGHLSKGTGTYCIVLEYITSSGDPVTREIYEGLKKTSKHRTALKACIVALSRLNKTCFANIHIDNTYVAETMIQEWYFKWNFEDWTNRGKPVKNSDLWQQLFQLLAKHKVKFIYAESNPYTAYTQNQLKHIEINYQEDRKESL